MEYLMTYGWAILVIAVVLGVLYSLGVFNPSNFAPKAQPGSCQVFRPNGPGTNYDLNLEGTCNGELPQYVGSFQNPQVTCTSTGQYIKDTSPTPSRMDSFTLAFWAYPSQGPNAGTILHLDSSGYEACGGSNGDYFTMNPDALNLRLFYSGGSYCAAIPISLKSLSFFAVIVNGTSDQYAVYENGATIQPSTAIGGNPSLGTITDINIGDFEPNCGDTYKGYLADVQVYNASLSANDIRFLYMGGVGDAPATLQNLVAWYPLNGNANDYSGNNNNAVSSNVMYTGSWTGLYSAP